MNTDKVPTAITKVLHEADDEIGYGENPRGSNKQKFAGEVGLQTGVSWCAIFVLAMLKRGGVTVPKPMRTASSRTMYAEAAKAHLTVKASAVRPGDVVHMTRGPRNRWLGHVALVEKVLPNGMLQTIEGNTNGGGSTTGGSVLRHTRKASAWNLGAWRPPYASTPATPPVRQLLLLPDIGKTPGKIVAWEGAMQDGARLVVWIQSGETVTARKAAGWVERKFDGKVTIVKAIT